MKKEINICYICFDTIKNDNDMIICKNNHKTHNECITKWFINKDCKSHCLLCISPLKLNYKTNLCILAANCVTSFLFFMFYFFIIIYIILILNALVKLLEIYLLYFYNSISFNQYYSYLYCIKRII